MHRISFDRSAASPPAKTRVYGGSTAARLVDNKTSFITILSAPKAFEEFTPEEKRLMVIIMAIIQEKIDNESLRNCFGITSEKASTLIKSMIADNVLRVSSRSRKYAKYILSESYREKIFG